MSEERGKRKPGTVYEGGYEREIFERKLGLGFLQNSDAFLKRFVLAQILGPPKALRKKQIGFPDGEET